MGDDTTTTATAEAPSSGAGADHLASLIGDGPAPTSAEPQTAEPTAPPSAEPAASVPPTATPSAPTTPTPTATPAAPKYKYKGREYTAAELEAAGLLGDVLTTAEQFPHLQKKYTETLEQQRQGQQDPGPQTPQRTPQQFMAQLRAQYEPEVGELVTQGLIEADAAELYPSLLYQGLYLRDWITNVAREFSAFRQQVSGFTGTVSAKDTMAGINAKLDGLAARGKIFEPLKDPAKRQEFFDFLTKPDGAGDPDTARMTPEFLARMWVAMNHEALLEATQQAAQAQQQADAQARARAAGDSRGARPAAPVPQPTNHLDRLVEGVLR